MRYHRYPPPSKEWIFIMLIGLVLLPVSPILSLVAMFFVAWLWSRPYKPKGISRKEMEKRLTKLESEARSELASTTETVFLCRSCGAVYTEGFLRKHPMPKTQDFPLGSIDESSHICFYCCNPIEALNEKQGYFEQQANTDNIKVIGSADFRKPLRFRQYVLTAYPVAPNKDLAYKYSECVTKQIFLHYVLWVQSIRQADPFAQVDIENLYPVMSYSKDLSDMSHKYDLVGREKVKKYDIMYRDIALSAVHNLEQ